MLTLLLLACGTVDPQPTAAPPPPAPVAPPPATPPPAAPPLPAIVVESPSAGARLTPRFEVRGTAMVWEGRVSVRLVDPSGAERARADTTAGGAAPDRGSFSVTLDAPPDLRGEATVEAYFSSPRDGSPAGVVKVPVLMAGG